jgi:glycosyltransferase involved in cell wall biosynthesis
VAHKILPPASEFYRYILRELVTGRQLSMNTNESSPLVSAVIPTRNRPDLVCRAIRTVLSQTYRNIEIVVVVDGRDSATIEALGQFSGANLRILALESSVGGSEARNLGVRNARGTWVALLDDDDEWMPTKIEEQICLAHAVAANALIVTRYIERASIDIVQPLLRPKIGQNVSDYVFSETSFVGFRKGFLQTSTWLVPREALLAVPFAKGLLHNQDTDWLLRAVPALKLEIHAVWKPLAIFHNEQLSDRITSKQDWKYSYDWAIGNRQYFTSRSLAYFVATVCVGTARRQGEGLDTLWYLLRSVFKYGRPDVKCIWLFFSNWFCVGGFGIRRRIQAMFSAKVHTQGADCAIEFTH